MRRIVGLVLLVGAIGSACTSDTGGDRVAGDPPASTGPSSTGPGAPEPDEGLPSGPPALARELTRTWEARRAAVVAWVETGGAAEWPPPSALELLVLREQRIYRELASDPHLAERVLARLPDELVPEAERTVAAGAALYEHLSPLERVPDLRTRPPEPAGILLGYFEAAEERFGVDWEVLAAVMLIETRMGRVVSHSSAGAQGPMQFLPATWATFGMGGDIRDERDAVMGAANYLAASGAPRDYRAALYEYNPVRSYVTAVTNYAKAMRREPETFYAYYNWQVFVRTTTGDVRLTGPGRKFG
ncbi:MAG TPA: lytic transglycosylase domain-containing protein [Actinomycetota bacterium]|jgi:soluble lytic murein transglycosylase-like protein|nr:lytic transglycosylase domain-containing protein [Actinomycetota bacterium]